ncbi:MAG: N-acetylmuramoyl-L-alanine amidase [Oscillospiraceae bacterium]
MRRAGLDDPGDGHRRLFRRLPHDRREKGLGHQNRASTVNQTEQPLLLSIHQNFFTEGKYHGAQVFYAKTPGSQQLAEQLQRNLALGLEPDNHRQCKNPTACT